MKGKAFIFPPEEKRSGHRNARLFLLLIAAWFLCVPFAACKGKQEAEPERLVNVRVWPAQVRNVQPYLETNGTLRADLEVIVSSEVDGTIDRVRVDEGDVVEAGALLAEVRDTDYRLDLVRAEAAFRQAQASLSNTKAEYLRKAALFEEELMTRQQFEDVSTRVTLAEAELERAKATLTIARERLARTKIYSPLVGAVKEKMVTVGNYVRNGTPLLRLIKTDPLRLNFTVSEKDIASLKIGQEVVFTVEALPERTFKGKVNLLYPNVEERTRTLQAEALVSNPDRVLKAGYFARLMIYTQAPRDVVVAPLTALIYDGGTIRIFVADGDTARERIVQIGGRYGEYVEVTDGLKESEQVVVVGQNNLTEGVKLHVAR
jgi:RND family efflux transporter MFP subunit